MLSASNQILFQLQSFLADERSAFPGQIYPPEDLVFSWMRYCNIWNVKVVILGQDPYVKEGQAHGLCFSVKVTYYNRVITVSCLCKHSIIFLSLLIKKF